ncbi:MAG: AAA family ATPase [Prevotella sp.]|nr:AAA family ATPase [Prevotella sp.]
MNYIACKVSKETILFMQGFEKDLKDKLKHLLSTPDFKKLKVNVVLSLTERDNKNKETIKIDSNAGFSIPSSNNFLQKANEYIYHHQNEIDAFIDTNQCLEIKFEFMENSKEEIKQEEFTFLPVTARYSFKQVIISEAIKQEIFDALNIIKYKDIIYKEWGFEEIDPIPKSVLNFYGPPGTGKTMCAHAVANEMEKKLLALNYAEIESKYVGEAPKNLMKAFECAKQNDCVLFFDEADSFLGKRIQNVTQGAEQALNSLRSQMLILLEEFSGIVIFATNLVSNFDKAFESRILKHIKFELPNEEARVQIIKKMIPSKLPLDKTLTDDNYMALSKLADGLSGREIKSCILECMLSKISLEGPDSVFNFQDFSESFTKKQESLKNLKEEADRIKKEKIIKAIQKSKDTIVNEETKEENGKES